MIGVSFYFNDPFFHFPAYFFFAHAIGVHSHLCTNFNVELNLEHYYAYSLYHWLLICQFCMCFDVFIAFDVFFTVIGVVLSFVKGFLAFGIVSCTRVSMVLYECFFLNGGLLSSNGQMLFLLGLTLTIGLKSSLLIFVKSQNFRVLFSLTSCSHCLFWHCFLPPFLAGFVKH